MCSLLLFRTANLLLNVIWDRILKKRHHTLFTERVVPGPLAMPIIDRSMASSQRTLASMQSRRASSSQGCRGIPISASRAGAARTAAILLLSCHDTITEVPCLSDKSRLTSGVLAYEIDVAYYNCCKSTPGSLVTPVSRRVFGLFLNKQHKHMWKKIIIFVHLHKKIYGISN